MDKIESSQFALLIKIEPFTRKETLYGLVRTPILCPNYFFKRETLTLTTVLVSPCGEPLFLRRATSIFSTRTLRVGRREHADRRRCSRCIRTSVPYGSSSQILPTTTRTFTKLPQIEAHRPAITRLGLMPRPQACPHRSPTRSNHRHSNKCTARRLGMRRRNSNSTQDLARAVR